MECKYPVSLQNDHIEKMPVDEIPEEIYIGWQGVACSSPGEFWR
jgi:hypothetical protein